MISYVKHMTCWQSIIFPTGTRLYCFDEGRGQYKMISWIGFHWWTCTFERLSNLWSFAHLSCRPCSSCLDAPRLRGETPCLDTPLLRGRHPVLTLLSRHSSFEGEIPCLDTPLLRGRHPVLTLLSRHSSFEGEIPCLDTPLLRGRHPVSALLVWGGVIMCTLQNFRVSLPYVHGRTRWSSVFHLLVLSPSAAGQLQKQCPCRWPSVTCECTAWIWSLFLVVETWRRNTTYLPDSDLKTLVFIH